MPTRFIFSNTDRPKRSAKTLRAALAEIGIDRSLGECLDSIAAMTGYRNWQELCQVTGSAPASPLDDAVDEHANAVRREQQADVLLRLGVPEADRLAIAFDLRLTGNPPQPPAGMTGFCTIVLGNNRFRCIVLPNGPHLALPDGVVRLGGPWFLSKGQDGWFVDRSADQKTSLRLPEMTDEEVADLSHAIGIGVGAIDDTFRLSPVHRDLQHFFAANPTMTQSYPILNDFVGEPAGEETLNFLRALTLRNVREYVANALPPTTKIN